MATIISRSPEETAAIGAGFAKQLRGGEVLALDGDLGAGKTQFAKGLAASLGYLGNVTSPTFGLVHEYRGGRLDCFHFDFYRIEEAGELEGIGFYDYLDESAAVCIVEWAGRYPEALPRSLIKVQIEIVDETERVVRIEEKRNL